MPWSGAVLRRILATEFHLPKAAAIEIKCEQRILSFGGAGHVDAVLMHNGRGSALARHSTFQATLLAFHLTGEPPAVTLPLAFGPRQCGQSLFA